MGVRQAIHSLENSDLVLLILDANEPLSAQDKHLTGLINERRKSLIIIVNKWDLFKEEGETAQENFFQKISSHFPFLSYAPVIFASAKTGWRVHKIFDLIKEVFLNRSKTIEEGTLSDFMRKLVRLHLPTKGRGVRHPRIYSLKQIATAPPTFQVTIKQKTSLHESYLKFIENHLRDDFHLLGTPVIVYAKKIKI